MPIFAITLLLSQAKAYATQTGLETCCTGHRSTDLCYLPEKFGGHLAPPGPDVAKTFPYVEKVRYPFDAEPMGQFHILVEQRIVVADHQHIIIPPEALEEPIVVER